MTVKNKIKLFDPTIGKEEETAVKKVLTSRFWASGAGIGSVQRFEKEFKQYKKSKYCLSVNSCTAGLHLSLMAMNIKPGDEVITTPLTFCSTINSILLVGAKPVLVDINPNTLNIDEEKIKRKV